MVVRKQFDRREGEMRLTALLGELDMTLAELDASVLGCGCCHDRYVTEKPNYWGISAEIESLRFMLDV